MCNRFILRAAVEVDLGGDRPLRPYGPKCAVKAGLIPAGKRREAPIHAFRRVTRDKRTADLFAEAS
ncbi:hypothetical protein [Hydrogenophaga sp. T2]|uniref:hypothetical protein n=1 Tax=Hydrogenophaga sp. T2 TaxID=3132823 RepID=UPI003CF2B7B4